MGLQLERCTIPNVFVRWAFADGEGKRGPPSVPSQGVLELVSLVVVLVVGQCPMYISGVVRLPGRVAWGSETGASKDGSLGPRR